MKLTLVLDLQRLGPEGRDFDSRTTTTTTAGRSQRSLGPVGVSGGSVRAELGTGGRWFGPAPWATRTRRGGIASEHDDARARQLEALRRYVAELGDQRQRPMVETTQPRPASDHQRRPSPPWLLLSGILVVVALVGAVAWSDDRPARGTRTAAVSSATEHPTTSIGLVARWDARRRSTGPT